jgi:hypothetical protein
MSLPAVIKEVWVPMPPDAAFALFTQRMGLWWPFAGHSCSGEAGQDVRFEPWVGGGVTEHAKDGRSFTWGRLLAWAPPEGFTMSWYPGLPSDEATCLSVSFSAEAEGTRVRIEHGGWEARGDQAQAKRDQYDGGWPATLMAFSQAAQGRP